MAWSYDRENAKGVHSFFFDYPCFENSARHCKTKKNIERKVIECIGRKWGQFPPKNIYLHWKFKRLESMLSFRCRLRRCQTSLGVSTNVYAEVHKLKK